MKKIKIHGEEAGEWIVATLIVNDERPDWVQVELDGETQWVEMNRVHPADQILLKVESVARQRYEWVPPEDIATADADGGTE